MAALDDHEVRLEAVQHALLHHTAAVGVGADHNGGADELLGLVERRALGDEEAEGAVRLTPTAAARSAISGCGPIQMMSSMSTSSPKTVASPVAVSRTAARSG